MIRELRASGRMELTVLLLAMAVLCFSMSLMRYLIAESGFSYSSTATCSSPSVRRGRPVGESLFPFAHLGGDAYDGYPVEHDVLDAKGDPEGLRAGTRAVTFQRNRRYSHFKALPNFWAEPFPILRLPFSIAERCGTAMPVFSETSASDIPALSL